MSSNPPVSLLAPEERLHLLALLARPARHQANNLSMGLSATLELLQSGRGEAGPRLQRMADAQGRQEALLRTLIALLGRPAEAPAAGCQPASLLRGLEPALRLLLPRAGQLVLALPPSTQPSTPAPAEAHVALPARLLEEAVLSWAAATAEQPMASLSLTLEDGPIPVLRVAGWVVEQALMTRHFSLLTAAAGGESGRNGPASWLGLPPAISD